MPCTSPDGRALEPVGIESMAAQRAFALLQLALARRGRGDLSGARALVEEARELIQRFRDPGSLPALHSPARRTETAAPLTERELVVLRLLPTGLSTREISRELSVSVHTVRSQVQAIYLERPYRMPGWP
jgi:LuxR family maltose regulon positive regulatory protein